MKHSPEVTNLLKYLAGGDEKANEDLVLGFFRKEFGDSFIRQKDAKHSDGYVEGNFVLEIKGNENDWLSGFFQAIAYSHDLDFQKIVVVCRDFFATWLLSELPKKMVDETKKSRSDGKAASAVGVEFSKLYKKNSDEIIKKSRILLLKEDISLAQKKPKIFQEKIAQVKEFLSKQQAQSRIQITPKNFLEKIESMKHFFEKEKPLFSVRAFYSLLSSWDAACKATVHAKLSDAVAVSGGDPIRGLRSDQRDKFCEFVQKHEISTSFSKDEYFARYDEALDIADKQFRITNGIFFTDLDLSRFAMWVVKEKLGEIGDKYLVIDPACGSGNLVTNWRSPLELRHKVVSEIEPELLFAIEQRMKGDEWHHGKFTVIPKVEEQRGLNFLDKSASEYLQILKKYLSEKGLMPNKPIAFLCNPPYRSDDDQASNSASYQISPEIVKMIGNDAASERYCCFLAQMKLICDQAEESGLPHDSLLMLFTKSAWLTDRPVFETVRREMIDSFESVAGFWPCSPVQPLLSKPQKIFRLQV